MQANIGFIDVKPIARGNWRPEPKTALVIFFTANPLQTEFPLKFGGTIVRQEKPPMKFQGADIAVG
ncbi:MAG: hypothetical protein HYS19_06385 [Nitrosomonadales bacterium]|nr:hypothetical protein [Nitrosomonadales bacterium]